MRNRSLMLLSLVAVLAMAGCGGPAGSAPAATPSAVAPQAAGGEPIKIGFLGGLTGPLAEYTAAAREVLDWQVDEINKKGGVLGRPLQIIYTDTKTDPQLARQAVDRFATSDKVVAMIGDYFSPSTAAVLQQLDRYQVPLVSPNSNATNLTQQGSKYFFRVVHSSKLEADTVASYSMSKLNAKKYLILGGTDGFSKANGDAFNAWVKASGKAEVLGYDTYDRNTTKDFTNLLLKYKEQQPDVLFLAGGLADGGLIVKQAREVGLKAAFFGSNAQARPGFQQIGGTAAVGTLLITDYPGDAQNWEQFADPSTRAFIAEFQARFGKLPNYDHVHARDSLQLIVEALKAAGKADGKAVRDQLAARTTFSGATGQRRFYPNGDSRAKMYIIRVEDGGKFTIVDVVADDGK